MLPYAHQLVANCLLFAAVQITDSRVIWVLYTMFTLKHQRFSPKLTGASASRRKGSRGFFFLQLAAADRLWCSPCWLLTGEEMYFISWTYREKRLPKKRDWRETAERTSLTSSKCWVQSETELNRNTEANTPLLSSLQPTYRYSGSLGWINANYWEANKLSQVRQNCVRLNTPIISVDAGRGSWKMLM